MNDVDKAIATQLANIERRTGKSLDQLRAIVAASGLEKHGELRDMLKETLGMGHGDANTLLHHLKQSATAAPSSPGDVVDEIYRGKESLRPIHDALMQAMQSFGPFEIAPKKGYLSLRRKKQFAMIGPTTKTRVDLGLNVKGLPADARLIVMPPNSMCQYQVRLTDAGQVTAELVGWIRLAWEAAG